MSTRVRYLLLTLFALAISALGFFQVVARTQGHVTVRDWIMMGVTGVLFIVQWALISKFQPYANQAITACVCMLTCLGVMMIFRIDEELDTQVAFRQLMWMSIALICCYVFYVFMHDYRVLRRFSYVSMVVGLVLLLSPMVPGLGREIGGARIWIGVGGYQLQPGEFAKLFLAFFFASYLFNHRDQLAVGGKKFLGIQLPRLKDLGPIVIVWLASMGVLILQHDLGTSLMFFAMFVAMLYVATGRVSWLIIGFLAFAIGCVAAVKIFPHVGYRVDAWLHPFDSEIYSRYTGGSSQIVQGLFGLAAGGLVGTGLGQGHPAMTPLANSDFIFASLGEELGLTGVFAMLMLYLLIIVAGMLVAMKIKDGFGKLLASGLVFTMAFQVFTVVGGITLVIPLTGLTMPYMAAGGSSLIANYVLAALLIIISNAANKPEEDLDSTDFKIQAASVLQSKREEQAKARRSARHSQSEPRTQIDPPTAGEQTMIVGPPSQVSTPHTVEDAFVSGQSQSSEEPSGTSEMVTVGVPYADTADLPGAEPTSEGEETMAVDFPFTQSNHTPSEGGTQ